MNKKKKAKQKRRQNRIIKKRRVQKIPELKPCPRCGSGVQMYTLPNKSRAFVKCKNENLKMNCNVRGPIRYSEMEALHYWNKAVDEELEQMKQEKEKELCSQSKQQKSELKEA